MASPIRSWLSYGCFMCGSIALGQQDTAIVVGVDSSHVIEVSTDSIALGQRDTAIVASVDSSHVIEFSTDSVADWRLRHSPGRATLYSAILPGAGQIYNRKYWKAPIAWGGIGLSIYFIQKNSKEYERYRDGYVALIDDDPSTESEFEGSNPQSVRDAADTYRKWRDQSYLALALVYILNVVDASVDAHFVRFDVSEDLSLNMAPTPLIAGQPAAGLSLSLALR